MVTALSYLLAPLKLALYGIADETRDTTVARNGLYAPKGPVGQADEYRCQVQRRASHGFQVSPEPYGGDNPSVYRLCHLSTRNGIVYYL